MTRLAEVARVLAALVGTLPGTVLGAICLAKLAFLDGELSVALAIVLAVPLWVLAICVVSTLGTATRAWVACAALALICGLGAYVA